VVTFARTAGVVGQAGTLPKENDRTMSRLLTLLFGAAAGAAAAHFLDPDSGARRRNQLRDKATSKARQGAGQAVGTATMAADKAKGSAMSAVPRALEPDRVEDADDVTLAHRPGTPAPASD
jgi:hypothetical protein